MVVDRNTAGISGINVSVALNNDVMVVCVWNPLLLSTPNPRAGGRSKIKFG